VIKGANSSEKIKYGDISYLGHFKQKVFQSAELASVAQQGGNSIFEERKEKRHGSQNSPYGYNGRKEYAWMRSECHEKIHENGLGHSNTGEPCQSSSGHNKNK
jgi:hypothetical protein